MKLFRTLVLPPLGRKPRLIPMSRQDELVNAELHRRRELRRQKREAARS